MGTPNRVSEGNECNKTQLPLGLARSRMIIHRDYDAHMLRFAHVLKQIKVNNPKTVLDVGCGDKQLAMVFYSNKSAKGIKEYHGVDLRDTTIAPLEGKNPFPIFFHKQDVCVTLPQVEPDILTCFEVIEHVSKEKGIELLKRIEEAMISKTTAYLSTPCFDGLQAENHVYEWKYEELKEELAKHFIIEDHFGTFMNTGRGPNKEFLENFVGKDTWERLKKYYHSSPLSNLFAPLFPERSRNVMWILKKKKETVEKM